MDFNTNSYLMINNCVGEIIVKKLFFKYNILLKQKYPDFLIFIRKLNKRILNIMYYQTLQQLNYSYLPNPLPGQDMTQGQFLSEV